MRKCAKMVRMQNANPSPPTPPPQATGPAAMLAPLPVGVGALRGLALLLLFQVAGEGLTRGFALPVPGPVVGLVLLLPALQWARLRTPVAAAADLLLAHLSLLFVPVGVGAITHLALVSCYGVQLLVVIVLSTWIGLAVTALAMRYLLQKEGESSDA